MYFLKQHQLSDSDISLAGDIRPSKKDFKERISDMFKRSGSTSRAGSQEKNINVLLQRPISISSTLPSNMTIQEISPKVHTLKSFFFFTEMKKNCTHKIPN